MPEGFLRLSIADAVRAFADGRLHVTDVARMCIEQVEAYEDAVRAWVCFKPEQLMQQAAALDPKAPHGALFGIPIGVKDIFNTKDFPTQMGSEIWKDFTPGNDARAVFHLTRAGALIPGKTETAEFAVHMLNATLNPHDPARTPGTSSSGSAAAVAAGMVPAALGTQTAASIIRPASFCGIYGFKPSFGLIPRTGMLKTTDSLDTVGFFTSHHEDLGIMLNALRVHGADYPMVDREFGDTTGGLPPRTRPWRVAMVEGPTWDHADSGCKQALQSWVQALERHPDVEIVDVTLPAAIDEAHATHSTIYDTSLAYYFRQESERTDAVSPVMVELMERGRKISREMYRSALLRQETLSHEIGHVFDRVDFLVTLSTSTVAPLRKDRERPDTGLIWTLLHLPALSAPVFRSESGLPFGLQIIGRRYSDLRMMEFVTDMVQSALLPERSKLPAPLTIDRVLS